MLNKLLCAMMCFILFVFLTLVPSQVRAIDLKEGIEKLANQLTQDARVEKPLTVAVMDFTDLQDNTNAFGQYIAEQLTKKLSQSPKFRVIEVQRGHLRSYVERILAELKFNMLDIVEPAQAKQLGKAMGVETLVVGTISNTISDQSKWESSDFKAWIIEVETGNILAEASTVATHLPPVFYISSGGGGRIIMARDYLLRSSAEAEGYGLYSYVVISKKADTEKQLNQYISLFKAYRAVIQPVEEFVKLGYNKNDLNVTYWLLNVEDPSKISEKEAISDWSSFITNYDYARAQSLLSHIERLGEEGPFIIGYVVPISGPNIPMSVDREKVLVVDLSKFHESDYNLVFQFYQQKVAQAPETWKKGFDLNRIRLTSRSMLLSYSESIISLVGFISKP